jgi:hypothetical protein
MRDASRVRELPLPAHFDPGRVGEVWRVPYEERAREARVWADRHALGPAAERDRQRLRDRLPPESSARFYARPGTVYRGVCGISASQVGIAWAAAADEDPLVQELVNCYAAAFGEERRTAKT